MIKNLLVLSVLVLVSMASRDGLARTGYYLIGDEPSRSARPKSVEELHPEFYFNKLIQNISSNENSLSQQLKSLFSFVFKDEPYGSTPEKYNRAKHFSGWLRDPSGETCMNTRALLLEQTSEVPVHMSNNGCTVRSGKWHDPYTNREYTDPADIQIDHFVPLKNAYLSGAYKWTREKRCAYSNYVGNKFHLLAVNGRENMSKSDRTPEGYIPPNKAYICTYLNQWLKVKLYWRLGLTLSEKESIQELAKGNNCEFESFSYSTEEMEKQKQEIGKGIPGCI